MEPVNQLPYVFPDPVEFFPRKARKARIVTNEDVVFQVLLRGIKVTDRQLVVCFHKPDPLGNFWLRKGSIFTHGHMLEGYGGYPELEVVLNKRPWQSKDFVCHWINPVWAEAIQQLATARIQHATTEVR